MAKPGVSTQLTRSCSGLPIWASRSGRIFVRSCCDTARRSVEPSAARERSGWYWSTVKVFRWEFGWKCLSGRSYTCGSYTQRGPCPALERPAATKPRRIIADTGYDSDPLRERLKKRAIELIARYRKNNKRKRYYDGRKMRRYKRRWIVERTNAWLGQLRRSLVRHEHLLSTYYAFFYLACCWITLRRCL
jgi:transposase